MNFITSDIFKYFNNVKKIIVLILTFLLIFKWLKLLEAQSKSQIVIQTVSENIAPHLRINQSNIITTENIELIHEKKDASSFGTNETLKIGDFHLPSLPPSLINLTKPILQQVRWIIKN